MIDEYKKEINEILGILGENLDIMESEYKIVVKSYEVVGNWFFKEDFFLYFFLLRIIF